MKPKVCGDPARMLDPFHIAKTTLFVILVSLNNSFSSDFMNEIFTGIEEFNKNDIIKIEYTRQRPETGEEARARWANEEEDRRAVALNKESVRAGMYYVDGKWVSKITPTEPLSERDLKDTDQDGYDDYTEYRHGTNHRDSASTPAIRDGNNKKIFK